MDPGRRELWYEGIRRDPMTGEIIAMYMPDMEVFYIRVYGVNGVIWENLTGNFRPLD